MIQIQRLGAILPAATSALSLAILAAASRCGAASNAPALARVESNRTDSETLLLASNRIESISLRVESLHARSVRVCSVRFGSARLTTQHSRPPPAAILSRPRLLHPQQAGSAQLLPGAHPEMSALGREAAGASAHHSLRRLSYISNVSRAASFATCAAQSSAEQRSTSLQLPPQRAPRAELQPARHRPLASAGVESAAAGYATGLRRRFAVGRLEARHAWHAASSHHFRSGGG